MIFVYYREKHFYIRIHKKNLVKCAKNNELFFAELCFSTKKLP